MSFPRLRSHPPPLKKGPILRDRKDKGVFWQRGLFKNVHFLEILEILGILETRRVWKTKENLRKDPYRNDPFFRSQFYVYCFLGLLRYSPLPILCLLFFGSP